MTVTEGFIEVAGGKVWYRKHEGKPDVVPLIVLHGGPGSSSYSLQDLRILSEDRPVIFYDQLGCGKSDRPNDLSLWNLERFVTELGQVVEGLSLERVHILGHSWGTTLAAAYLLTKPTGVDSVIFSSPCLSAPLWAEDQKRNLRLLPEDVQKVLAECEEKGTTDSEEYKKAMEEFNKRFVCRKERDPEIIKKAAPYRNSEIYQIMWGPSEFHVTGNLKDFDCTPKLKEIEVPALYTCGRFDEATPESTELFSSLTPNSRFHVFENSAHMPYFEEQAEYVAVVRGFLKSVDENI